MVHKEGFVLTLVTTILFHHFGIITEIHISWTEFGLEVSGIICPLEMKYN